MSKEIASIKGTGQKNADLDVTEYYGGKDKGVMLQFTQGLAGIPGVDFEPGYIQLTKKDVKKVIVVLSEWLNKLDTHN